MRGLLIESEQRVRDRMASVVMANFPSLDDERQLAALHDNLRRTTDRAVTEAIVECDQRFASDAEALQDDVVAFDVSDTDEPTVELQKRFMRSWLHLLDREIERL